MHSPIATDKWIVITGAAGMIGSATVRHLNDCGYTHLLLVDDVGSADKWENLVGKQFSRLIGIQDLFAFIEGRSQEIAAFIHLGACSDTLETRGDFLLENNYRYSIRLAEYALAHGHRFIYASSAATYGLGEQGFIDDHALLPSLRPLNLYGFSKHLFDLWLQQEGVLDQVVGLKYFNVFGPNENHKGRMASMVYKMVPLIATQGFLELYASCDPSVFADGEQKRDFIYVKDVARLTVECIYNGKSGILNMGSGIPSSWNTLASCVFRAMGKAPSIQYIPMPQELAKQYQNFTCADMRKWSAPSLPIGSYSLEEGVKDYVQNYLLPRRRW